MLVDMLLKNGDKLLRFDVTCGSWFNPKIKFISCKSNYDLTSPNKVNFVVTEIEHMELILLHNKHFINLIY
jgi:hypothetical protein